MTIFQTSRWEGARALWFGSVLATMFAFGCGGEQSSAPAKGTTESSEGESEPRADIVIESEPQANATARVPRSQVPDTTGRPRVVGYLQVWRNRDPSKIDFDTLTHLCLAFANPPAGDPAVKFPKENEPSIRDLVHAAHEKGVKVLASIGGGDLATAQPLFDHIKNNRGDQVIRSLVELVRDYSLDGIDVDLEGDHVKSSYEPFVQALATALPETKLLTAAVKTWESDDAPYFPDGALAEFNFINIMAYDDGGGMPADHSSMENANRDLRYWEDRIHDASRVVLGVPFYAHCWGQGCPRGLLSYAEALAFDSGAALFDRITTDTYDLSLNRPQTIADKASLAKTKGGIMIWELGQDSADGALFSAVRAAQ
ncbi:MAG TPA: glycosyl hydrolase family 18 protein [Polyangiaceae bacterium]|nr:glycosyl hydrolase family 18 protein [Polyangiaceae bacterium]